MDEKLVQTAFRLAERELTQLDALVEDPPFWLRAIAPGRVMSRTDVVRRLIFSACQQGAFGKQADPKYTGEGIMPKPRKRGRKPAR